MKGDFSRNTFDPSRSFTRVLMQQGRVQIDADSNEQTAIFWHFMRGLGRDLIGPHGGPADDLGYEISPGGQAGSFQIGPGHYYVQGQLCTNRESLAYDGQPDYPLPEGKKLEANQAYLIYLDAWERHLTHVQDDAIREVALDGPDTASRAKLVAQVKAIALGDAPEGAGEQAKKLQELYAELRRLIVARQQARKDEKWTEVIRLEYEIRAREQELQKLCWAFFVALLTHLGKMGQPTLEAKTPDRNTSEDPCILPPDARFRGSENQLYRVEIHRGGQVGGVNWPTFKWSRENGSVVFPLRAPLAGGGDGTALVSLENLGRDDRLGLEVGDWVEVVDDDQVLQPRAEWLLKVVEVDRVEMRVTLEGQLPGETGQDMDKHPLLRRWEQKASDDEDLRGGVPLVEKKWLDLEDGIQIRFGEGGTYQTGDYWLIPARTELGDVWLPFDRHGGTPDGIDHAYAPLAFISTGAGGVVDNNVVDCRRSFEALARPVVRLPSLGVG